MQTTNPPEKINFQDRINKLQFKEKIEEFNTNLEKGDLGLSEVVENAYILYGDTRAGKTTLGHLLNGGSLHGIKLNGEFMAQATTSKNRNAKIGNTMRSETLVPNKFSVRLKTQK